MDAEPVLSAGWARNRGPAGPHGQCGKTGRTDRVGGILGRSSGPSRWEPKLCQWWARFGARVWGFMLGFGTLLSLEAPAVCILG